MLSLYTASLLNFLINSSIFLCGVFRVFNINIMLSAYDEKFTFSLKLNTFISFFFLPDCYGWIEEVGVGIFILFQILPGSLSAFHC